MFYLVCANYFRKITSFDSYKNHLYMLVNFCGKSRPKTIKLFVQYDTK